MSVGLAAQLDVARTALAALSPATTTPTAGFTEQDALLHLEHAPPVMDRTFDVQPGPAFPVMTGEMSSDTAQFLGQFSVMVRYDGLADVDALGNRVAEDSESIVIALESTTNYATNVQRVTLKSTSVGTGAGDSGQFVLMTLIFECVFRRAIP